MASGSTIDALGQFELHPIFGSFGEALRFSQAPLFMMISSAVVLAFLYIGMKPKAIVPGRLQAAAEVSYDFVHGLAVDTIGEGKGTAFFPFIFSLFFFILVGNYIGLLPFSYTFTSHIAVTFALAITVFILCILTSLRFQGMNFFKHFMPEGAPMALSPILVPIEILSYISRPVSLSIRLFANMVAGHVLLEVFASFTIMLAGLGVVGDVLAVTPLVLNIALTALELLVGLLQAYVFAILTCIYLREAVDH